MSFLVEKWLWLKISYSKITPKHVLKKLSTKPIFQLVVGSNFFAVSLWDKYRLLLRSKLIENRLFFFNIFFIQLINGRWRRSKLGIGLYMRKRLKMRRGDRSRNQIVAEKNKLHKKKTKASHELEEEEETIKFGS